MKVFRFISHDNGEITIRVNNKCVKQLNDIINKYIQSEWGDKDDPRVEQLNNDMADDILEMHNILNPS